VPQLTHVRRRGPQHQHAVGGGNDGFVVPAPRPVPKRTINPRNTHFPRDFCLPGEKPIDKYDFTSVPNPSLRSWSHGLRSEEKPGENDPNRSTTLITSNQANASQGLQSASAFGFVEASTPMTGSPIMTWGEVGATPMHLEEEDIQPLVLDHQTAQSGNVQKNSQSTRYMNQIPSSTGSTGHYAHNPPAPALVRGRAPPPSAAQSTSTRVRGFRLLEKSDADRGAEKLFSQAKRPKTPGSQIVEGMKPFLSASRTPGSQTPSVWGIGSATPKMMSPMPYRPRK
jgi:hypothetical protein